MKAARGNSIHTREVSASALAARHHRVAPKRRPRGLPTDPRRRTEANRRKVRASRAAAGLSRAQVVAAVRTCLVLGVAITIVVGILGAYRAFASSSLFTLRQIDLQGVAHASRDDLMRGLRRSLADGLWKADLDKVRVELEGHAWVRSAEVVRVLPDTLRVVIKEREPFVLARRSTGALVWVDRDGVGLGERHLFKTETVLPLISGLEEGESDAASEANRQRLIAYQQLLAELDQGEPRLSEILDEVNLGDLTDVRLRLMDKRVTVIVGEHEFRSRLEAALKVLNAIERKDISTLGLFKVTDAERLIKGNRIASLNATQPGRVIVGLAQ
jgi:cell division protein FtsQ